MYNNNNNNNKNQKNLGGLYRVKAKNGTEYLRGKINGENIVIYKNNYKSDPKHPDYVVFKAYEIENNRNHNGNGNNNYGGYNSYNQNNGYKNNNSGYQSKYNQVENNNYGGGYKKTGENEINNIIPEERGLNEIDF